MGTFTKRAGKALAIGAVSGALLGGLAVSSAQAADPGSAAWYLRAFGGGNFQLDGDYRGTITPPGGRQNVDVDFDDGFVVGGAVGVKLPGMNLGALTPRAEIEVSYRENDVDSVDFTGNGAGAEANPRGDVSSIFLMGNVLFDINAFESDFFTPYFGGGIGVAFVDNNIRYGPLGPGVNLLDSDEAFAVQAIIGANFKVTENISFNIDGRYYNAFDVSSVRLNPAGVNTGSTQTDLDGFSVTGGFSISLGAFN
ncbi:MAG: outer membrane beta-barrel protein [Pseudomonadota bacterium]